MKTLVDVWFDKFLDFMEPAFLELGTARFKELEDKIIREIEHRQNKI